ncbi:MAG: BfmA/BtgA family mobilization protein [Candidatus Aenigmatarchaeota archaeon]
MVLTSKGKSLHDSLVDKAVKKFESMGYTVVREAKINKKNRIDALALKNKEKIGIECQLTISYKILKEKLNRYGHELTKIILIIPSYREKKANTVIEKLKNKNNLTKNFFEIWPEKVEEFTSIRLSKNTKSRFEKYGECSDTHDDILNRLIDYFEKHQKKKVVKNGSS